VPPTVAAPERPRVPRREELADGIVSVLRTGRRGNADLYIVDVGDGPMVVKDFAPKSWWVRLLGRPQVVHECRAYEWLDGLEGIPRFIGRIDRFAFAIERVEATQLTYASNRYSAGPRHLANLREVLGRFLERGFVHLDLRGRRNILLRPDGRIVVLDLAGALWFRPGGLWHRALARLIAWNHENTLFKWKVLLAPRALSGEERSSLHRFRRLQRLWLFNRKGSRDAEWPMDFPRLVKAPGSGTDPEI
jgi:hypothetical protein